VAIDNALAGIMVSAYDGGGLVRAIAFPSCRRSTHGGLGRVEARGRWVDSSVSRQRSCRIVLGHILVSSLDDQLGELRAKGISIERTTTSDHVKTATVTDPAGNRVVFAGTYRAIRELTRLRTL
jgi:hypothetical protein